MKCDVCDVRYAALGATWALWQLEAPTIDSRAHSARSAPINPDGPLSGKIERCVPLDHADSNARGAFEAFLGAAGVPAAQVHTIDGALSPAEEAARYEAKMRSAMASGAVATNEGWAEEGGDVVPPMPRLDLILLGMGPDGHCASLFPGHPLMEVKDRAVAFIEDSPKPPPGRITLTLPCLCAAREVIFVAAGEGKAQVVADVICEGERDGVPLPAAMVEPVDGNLIYLIDEAGAALIE